MHFAPPLLERSIKSALGESTQYSFAHCSSRRATLDQFDAAIVGVRIIAAAPMMPSDPSISANTLRYAPFKQPEVLAQAHIAVLHLLMTTRHVA